MFRLRSAFVVLGLLLGSNVFAFQQDELDEDIFDEDDEEDDDSDRIDEDDTLEGVEPEGDEDWIDDLGAEGEGPVDPEELEIEDEFDEDTDVQVSGPGQDNARVYREQLEKVEDMSPDEESLAWERYLKKHYNTVFRSRIEARIDELSKELYEGRIEDQTTRFVDAGKSELKFAQPMHLESIDPRSRLRAGFELGFPNYFNILLGGEYQIRREWSGALGVRYRYTGWNVEAGTRYALIKSSRTRTLLTAIGDVHLNMNPMHLGLRPQLGFGQRFGDSQGLYIDAQLQAGSDLLMLTRDDGDTVLSPRLIGGLNVTVVPNKTVRAYFETSTYMKGMFDETVPSFFRFNLVTFGIKFVQRKTATKDRSEIGIGASAPYSSYYWGYHYGAVMADYNFFVDG